MIIGIDNILNWIETNQTPYWYVRDGSSERASLIFSAQTGDETISLTDSKEKLEACLKTLAPGNYTIEAWAKEGQTKSRNKTKFQITSGGSIAHIGNVPQVPQQAPQDIAKLIDEALERERNKNKLERLEADIVAKDKRIKELESELDSSQMRIGKRFDQVFGDLLSFNTEKQPNEALGQADDESEQIAQLMEKWAEKDPEFTSVLNGIVNLAYNNPTKYAMGKNLLK